MRRERVFLYLQLLLLWLIVFLLSAILTSRHIEKGDWVAVPELAGKTLTEARADLAGRKLSLQEKGIQPSDRYEKGRIVLQEPPAGSKIRVNRAVRVVISSGSELVEIPQLVGRSLESAAKILVEIGLQRGLLSQIHTAEYAAGRIIAQEPAPSAGLVKRNTPINFLISQGESELKYIMPDLIGKRAGPAIARLNALGFRIADIRQSYYPGLGSGLIIKQFPAQGYPIARRNLITFEVSR